VRQIANQGLLAVSSISIQNDHQIHHRGLNRLQPFLPQSKDRTTIPLFPPTECATDDEDKYKALTEDVEGAQLDGVEIQ
jgi:hypothetical protein